MNIETGDRITSEAIVRIRSQTAGIFGCLISNGIKKSALDEFERFVTAPDTLSQRSMIIRCQVAKHSYSIRTVIDKPISRWRVTECFEPFLKRVLSRLSIEADFFVLVSDSIYVSDKYRSQCLEFLKTVPFLRCDCVDDDALSMNSLLIPDFLMQAVQYKQELGKIEQAVRKNPFNKRIEMVKWRGSLHGTRYVTEDNYHEFPRYKLLTISQRHPDKVDARLTNYSFYNSDGEGSGAELSWQFGRMFGSPASVLPAAAFVPYKYLISLDGAVAAWKRVATILFSGSVLMLQHRWREFFYVGLKPWVHYVPVEYDVSNVIEQYEWLKAHPEEARTIADNGRRFAQTILTPTALETHFVEIVARCGELYTAR
jgi:hypothetical protein